MSQIIEIASLDHLSAFVAEHIMGWTQLVRTEEVKWGVRTTTQLEEIERKVTYHGLPPDVEQSLHPSYPVPGYARSLDSAWKVVEQITSKDQISFEMVKLGRQAAALFRSSEVTTRFSSENPALAICMSALKIKGHKVAWVVWEDEKQETCNT